MKFCTLCKQEKPTLDFAKHSTRKDGLQSVCRACSKVRGAARYQLTKKEHLESNRQRRIRNQIAVYEFLKTQKCADCPIRNPVVLTFDHVRGEKFMEVSNMVKQSYSLQTIFDEIAKCEVRCFNCHMIKDSLRRGGKKWNALNEVSIEPKPSVAPLASPQSPASHTRSFAEA